MLHDFQFSSPLHLVERNKRQLHTLSKNLLELASIREILSDAKQMDAKYLDLVEYLLVYSTICVEITSLAKSISSRISLKKLSKSSLMTKKRVTIKANGLQEVLDLEDIVSLVIHESKSEDEEALTRLSLSQLSLKCILACKIDIEEESIEIIKPENFEDKQFYNFVQTCLIRIPKIESIVIRDLQALFLSFSKNEDFNSPLGFKQIREILDILVADFRMVRKKFIISRQRGRADGYNYPIDVSHRT